MRLPFFCLSQSDTIADGSGPSVSDRLDSPTFPTLCKGITLVMRMFSKSLASDFRLVGSGRTLHDPTQFGCIGQPSLLEIRLGQARYKSPAAFLLKTLTAKNYT